MRNLKGQQKKRFLMPRYQPKLTDKDESQISSKDITKFQLLGYIFGDFMKGGFVVTSLFIDVVLIPEPYTYIPSFYLTNYTLSYYFGGFQLLSIFVLILIVFSELIIIYIEIKIYQKIWGKNVVPWYYRKHES